MFVLELGSRNAGGAFFLILDGVRIVKTTFLLFILESQDLFIVSCCFLFNNENNFYLKVRFKFLCFLL